MATTNPGALHSSTLALQASCLPLAYDLVVYLWYTFGNLVLVPWTLFPMDASFLQETHTSRETLQGKALLRHPHSAITNSLALVTAAVAHFRVFTNYTPVILPMACTVLVGP